MADADADAAPTRAAWTRAHKDAVADASRDTSLSDDAGGPRPDATSPDAGNPVDSGSDTGTPPVGLDRFIAGGGCHCATAGDQGWGVSLDGGAVGAGHHERRRRR